MMGFATYKNCDRCGVSFLAAPGQWKCSACLVKRANRRKWAQRRAAAAVRHAVPVDRSYEDDAELYRQHLRGELD
jgi:hypothetical protein